MMRSIVGEVVTIAALMGLGTLLASPALADEYDYLRNLYSVGIPQSGAEVADIYVKLGGLACTAQAAGFDKSEQEELVAEAADKALALRGSLTVSDLANRIARSARMFLC